MVEETDVESVNLDTGRAGQHAWRINNPSTSFRGGYGGATCRIGRNEGKVGDLVRNRSGYVACGDSVA